MSLKSATEQIQEKSRIVTLEQENDLLKAALLESKQAYEQQAKVISQQIMVLNNRIETLCKAVDASNESAGQNIQIALKSGCDGALASVTDETNKYLQEVKKYAEEVKKACQNTGFHVWLNDATLMIMIAGVLVMGFTGLYYGFWGNGATIKAINNTVWQLANTPK